MNSFAQARINMVESQIRPADMTDRRILAAMNEVAREAFVPPAWRALAYADREVPVNDAEQGREQRFLLDPRVFAKLVHLAAVKPGDVVLDVGCATGYSSAILSRLSDAVVAIEADEALAGRANDLLAGIDAGSVAVVCGPLAAGYPAEGPYDVILLNGSVEEVPAALFSQLNEGGRLVGVISRGVAGKAWLYLKAGGKISGRTVFDASASPLPGFAQEKAFSL